MSTSDENNIKYFKMALALSGIAVSDFTAELIIELWDGIIKKGGKFSVKDSVEIEFRVMHKYRKVVAGKHKTNQS